MSERKALKLKFEPDDYLCTWQVPKRGGDFISLPGSLEVRPDRPPRGVLYGEVPLESNHTASGESSAGFPQTVERPILRGILANGGEVVVLDARLVYWFPGQGTLSGSAGILTAGNTFFGGVGRSGEVGDESVPVFAEAEFQVTGLDAVAGAMPIRHTTLPGPEASERTWSATYNNESTLEWEDDSATLSVGYNGLVRAADGYEFQLRFSPTATVRLPRPATLRSLVDDWVQPIRRMVSIATGKPETLTYLAVRPAGSNGSRTPWSQVFGVGIEQEPFESSTKNVRDKSSALYCSEDDTSLLAMTRQWQALTEAHHPLIETYGSMLSVPDQHPRSRYLLLIQAIEGMYGHDTREARDERDARYAEQRAAYIERASDLLEPDDVKFLRRRLAKHLPSGLDEALTRVITDLPVDLLPEVQATTVISGLIAAPDDIKTPQVAMRQLRNDLAHGQRGYDAHDLHEVVSVLERVVRAHALRALGCPDVSVTRALERRD